MWARIKHTAFSIVFLLFSNQKVDVHQFRLITLHQIHFLVREESHSSFSFSYLFLSHAFEIGPSLSLWFSHLPSRAQILTYSFSSQIVESHSHTPFIFGMHKNHTTQKRYLAPTECWLLILLHTRKWDIDLMTRFVCVYVSVGRSVRRPELSHKTKIVSNRRKEINSFFLSLSLRYKCHLMSTL